MWRELITQSIEEAVFSPSVSGQEISDLERNLGFSLPNSLKSLLSETDGVTTDYGLGIIWSALDIRQYNTRKFNSEFRYGLEGWFFFADAGNGDEYAMKVSDLSIAEPAIFVWRHEDSNIEFVADSLQNYILGFSP